MDQLKSTNNNTVVLEFRSAQWPCETALLIISNKRHRPDWLDRCTRAIDS